ncbi:Hsp20 family protein [Candidatus Poribacteria bacterium]|nr:Hsp20 family protein [Candidatus Poribacteria bacterium]
MQDFRDFEKELKKLREKMDKILVGSINEPETLEDLDWIPELDVLEDKDNITVRIDLPGMSSDSIDLSISGNSLMIRGTRKPETGRKDENFHTIERGFGNFRRYISLPAPVEEENVKAIYKDGVLTVKLPKKTDHKIGKKVILES